MSLFEDVQSADESLLGFVDKYAAGTPEQPRRRLGLAPAPQQVYYSEEEQYEVGADEDDDDEVIVVDDDDEPEEDASEPEDVQVAPVTPIVIPPKPAASSEPDSGESSDGTGMVIRMTEGATLATVTVTGDMTAVVTYIDKPNGERVYVSKHFDGEQKNLKRALETAVGNIARRAVSAQWVVDHPKPSKSKPVSAKAAESAEIANMREQLAAMQAQMAESAKISSALVGLLQSNGLIPQG